MTALALAVVLLFLSFALQSELSAAERNRKKTSVRRFFDEKIAAAAAEQEKNTRSESLFGLFRLL